MLERVLARQRCLSRIAASPRAKLSCSFDLARGLRVMNLEPIWHGALRVHTAQSRFMNIKPQSLFLRIAEPELNHRPTRDNFVNNNLPGLRMKARTVAGRRNTNTIAFRL